MRKSWLFLTLVLLHLTPGTARALCPPGQPLCDTPCISAPPAMAAPSPPLLVATPPAASPDQQASQLYGVTLIGLATLVGAGFWMRARQRPREDR